MAKDWKNTNPPFPDCPARYFVVGPSDTGKTTLCVRIIKQLINDKRDPRHHLVIVSPNYDWDPQLQKLAQFAAGELKLVVKVFKGFTRDGIEKFITYMGECKNQGMRSTIYIDDPVGIGQFTSSVNQKSPFNSFVTGIKHFKADMIFSTQAIGSLSPSARENIDVFIFLPNSVARPKLYDACPFVDSRADFYKLMDHYASEPYHAIWINLKFGRKGIFRINAQGQISPITSIPA